MSAEHTQTTYSKSERSRMNRERHLSDHVLLFSGADYEGDRLTPTAEQVAAIRREHEPAPPSTEVETKLPKDTVAVARNMAQHVLMRPDPLYAELEKPQEQANNEKALREATELMLQPYESYYAQEVPDVSANKRGVWTGKLKTESAVTKPRVDVMTIDTLDVEFSTKLQYRPGEKRNSIEKTQIRIKPKDGEELTAAELEDRSDVYPRLGIEYSDHGNITALTLNRLSYGTLSTQVFHNPSTPQHPVGEFIDSVNRPMDDFDDFDDGYAGFDMKVDLTDVPTIKVGGRSYGMNEHAKATPLCEYRYSAKDNEFVLHNSTDYVKRPETMSIQDYLKLLEAMLSLVPAAKVAI